MITSSQHGLLCALGKTASSCNVDGQQEPQHADSTTSTREHHSKITWNETILCPGVISITIRASYVESSLCLSIATPL